MADTDHKNKINKILLTINGYERRIDLRTIYFCFYFRIFININEVKNDKKDNRIIITGDIQSDFSIIPY